MATPLFALTRENIPWPMTFEETLPKEPGLAVLVISNSARFFEVLSKRFESAGIGCLHQSWADRPCSLDLRVDGVIFDTTHGILKSSGDPGKLGPEDLQELLKRIFRGVYEPCKQLSSRGGNEAEDGRRRFAISVSLADQVLETLVQGVLKCLQEEQPRLAVKSVTFEAPAPADSPDEMEARARILLEEALHFKGLGLSKEVHYQDGQRKFPLLREIGRPGPERKPVESWLPPGSVVLVTGGCRGILPGILLELARRAPGLKFVFSGRTQLVQPEFSREELVDKRALRAKLSARFPGISPSRIVQKVQEIESYYEVVHNLLKLSEFSQPVYKACDVTRLEALEEWIRSAYAEFGRVDAIIHASGVALNYSVEEHTEEQLSGVALPKLMPLLAFSKWIDFKSLKAFFSISSSAAYYGNAKQSSYSGANLVLESYVSRYLAGRYPHLIAKSLAYGAWSSGMVTEGLKARLSEQGISCIEGEVGNRTLADQLCEENNFATILHVPQDPFFQQPLEFESNQRRLLEQLSGHPFVRRIAHLERGSIYHLVCGFEPRHIQALQEHLFFGVPVVPASMLLTQLIGIGTRLFPDRRYLTVQQYDAKNMVVIRSEQDELQLQLTAGAAGELGFVVLGRQGVCVEARMKFDKSPTQTADSVSEGWGTLGMAARKLYSTRQIDLGPAFHIVECVLRVDPFTIQTEAHRGAAMSRLESCLESITQTNAIYGCEYFGAASFPYRISNLEVNLAALGAPDAGSEASPFSMRVHLSLGELPLRAPTIPTSVRVFGPREELLAWGGPWTNVYQQSVSDSVWVGPRDRGVQCFCCDLTAIPAIQGTLDCLGVDFERMVLGPGESCEPGALLEKFAIKSLFVREMARRHERKVMLSDFSVTVFETGFVGCVSEDPDLASLLGRSRVFFFRKDRHGCIILENGESRGPDALPEHGWAVMDLKAVKEGGTPASFVSRDPLLWEACALYGEKFALGLGSYLHRLTDSMDSVRILSRDWSLKRIRLVLKGEEKTVYFHKIIQTDPDWVLFLLEA